MRNHPHLIVVMRLKSPRIVWLLGFLIAALPPFFGSKVLGQCCQGDANADGVFDIQDVAPFVTILLGPPDMGTPEFCRADVNEDSFIDGRDVAEFVRRFLSSAGCPPIECGSPCQPNSVDTGSGWAFAISSSESALADDFLWTASSTDLTEICWEGGWGDIDLFCDIASEDFIITYYADGGGFPGAIAGGPFRFSDGSLRDPAQEFLFNLVVFNVPVYTFTATHDPVPVEQGQCYWVSISHVGTAPCNFGWLSGSGGNERSYEFAPEGGISHDRDWAFCINGSSDPFNNWRCASAELVAPVIHQLAVSANPVSNCQGSLVFAQIVGENFSPGVGVTLTQSGQSDILAFDVVFVSPELLNATFLVGGAPTGLWQFLVTNPNGQSARSTERLEIIICP